MANGNSFFTDIFLIIFLALYLFYIFKFRKILQDMSRKTEESYEGNSFMNFIAQSMAYLSFQSINIIVHTLFIVIIVFFIFAKPVLDSIDQIKVANLFQNSKTHFNLSLTRKSVLEISMARVRSTSIFLGF